MKRARVAVNGYGVIGKRVAVCEDALASHGSELFFTYQVHNESIVVPETVDCIRALLELERSGPRSIAKTDAAMGIVKRYLPATSDGPFA